MKDVKPRHSLRYNKAEFERILNSITTKNQIYLETEILKYLEKYPRDISGYLTLIRFLIINNRVDEARKLISKVEPIATLEEDKRILFYDTIRILILERKYQECYSMIKEDKKYFYTSKFNDLDLEIMLLLKQKLNIGEDLREDVTNYIQKQLIEYDESSYLNYILGKKDPGIAFHVRFNQDFPLIEIQDRIQEELDSAYPLNERIVTTGYIFKYDGCGIIDGVETDYFLVSTIVGTHDIVTMYPFNNTRRFPYININDFRYNVLNGENKDKVKVLSQVERFKKRYHID